MFLFLRLFRLDLESADLRAKLANFLVAACLSRVLLRLTLLAGSSAPSALASGLAARAVASLRSDELAGLRG